MKRLFRRWSVIAMAAITVVSSAGCATAENGHQPAPSTSKSATRSSEIDPSLLLERGSVVESQIVADPSDPVKNVASRQIKMVYRSVSGIDGTIREVSGTVVVPNGSPPAGGWPTIAYGHGLTGIGIECGPSAYRDLLGYDLVVASLVDLGYVVTLPDYEGLGHEGTHPALEPRTAAFNMIDSVRAAHELVEDTSGQWFAVGISQGGQAAWAANEYAGDYGQGLDLLGSASMAPVADMSKLPELASSGWLTTEQQVLLPMLVYGLRNSRPDLRPGDYLHGALSRHTDVWLACAGPLLAERSSVAAEIRRSDSEPSSKAAAEKLSQYFSDYAVPQRPATAPMLVITGGEDETIRAQWVRGAVQKACAMGDTIEFIVRPNEGHANLDGGPRLSQWLTERSQGVPPVDSCGQL